MKKNLLLLLAPFLFACSNYGSKATSDNIEVYYKEGITKEQAEKPPQIILKSITKKAFQKNRLKRLPVFSTRC